MQKKMEAGLRRSEKLGPIWGFPKIRGTLLGVTIIRLVVFWGLFWGPLVLGNSHIPGLSENQMDKKMESTMHAGFMAIVMSGRHFLNTAMGVHYAAAMYGSSANQILIFFTRLL